MTLVSTIPTDIIGPTNIKKICPNQYMTTPFSSLDTNVDDNIEYEPHEKVFLGIVDNSPLSLVRKVATTINPSYIIIEPLVANNKDKTIIDKLNQESEESEERDENAENRERIRPFDIKLTGSLSKSVSSTPSIESTIEEEWDHQETGVAKKVTTLNPSETVEEQAWQQQEEDIALESKCGKCAFGTNGPCQNPKDKVCYPRDQCPPGTADKTECCPPLTIECQNESFINRIDQISNSNKSANYTPYSLFLIALVAVAIYYIYLSCH